MFSNWNLKLGRLRGVDIEVHWTLVLLAIFSLSLEFFSGHSAGQSTALVSIWFGVFASIFLHEFGHIWAASKFGISTRRLTLSPLGGQAELEGFSKHPSDNFWIALMGPMTNVCIALSLWFVGGVFSYSLPITFSPLLFDALNSLIWINLGLAAFNLLPAYPMDGGRILQSFLEKHQGKMKSIETSVSVSKIFSIVFVVFGIFQAPILAMIGVYIWVVGSRELRAAQMQKQYENWTRQFNHEFSNKDKQGFGSQNPPLSPLGRALLTLFQHLQSKRSV